MKNSGGRPRSAAIDEAVLASTIRLLNEHGYADLRINDIARESKTAKTTIYRRWPTMIHLVVDAMEHALGQRAFAPTGAIEEDLDRLTEAALKNLTGEGASLMAIALDIHRQNDGDLRTAYRQRVIDPVREQAIALVRGAQQRGELDDKLQPETLVDAVIGSVIYRAAILGEPLSITQTKQLWRDISGYPGSTATSSPGVERP